MSAPTDRSGNFELQDPSEVGDLIRDARLLRDLTQSGLGLKIFQSQQWISDVENGKIDPTVTQIKAIALALDVDICQLIKLPN